MYKNAQPIPTKVYPKEADASLEKAKADVNAAEPDTPEEAEKILEENEIGGKARETTK